MGNLFGQGFYDFWRNLWLNSQSGSAVGTLANMASKPFEALGLPSTTGLYDSLTGKANTDAQNAAAAVLQEDAQAHQKEVLQNQHQWEVQDLQNAGLNPWLSAGNGVQSGSAGIASAQASNVNALASIGSAAAGIGILIKAVKAAI